MKVYKVFFMSLTILAALGMQSCEEEVVDGVVDFSTSAINRTTDDLSDVTVEFTIDPAAPMASNIYVSVSGAEYGTVFSTSPAATSGQVKIPVSVDATSASMTVILDEEAIGFDDVALTFTMDSTSKGLTTGLTTSLDLNISNANDKGLDLPLSEEFGGCPTAGDTVVIPAGWEEVVVAQNAELSSRWSCVNEDFFGHGGLEANCFVPGSSDETPSEVWLVTPRLNLLDATSPKLNFDVDRRFGGTGSYPEDLYDILISTDYTGLNMETATWNRFTAGFDAMTANSPDSDDIGPTGDLDLSAYAGNVIAIAFVYRAGGPSTFDATILRIDNVDVFEATK